MKASQQGVRYRAGKDWGNDGRGSWDSLTIGSSAVDFSNREIERIALAFLYSEAKVSQKITQQLEALSKEDLRKIHGQTNRLLTDTNSFKGADVDRALKALSRVVKVSLEEEVRKTRSDHPKSLNEAPARKQSVTPKNARASATPTSKPRTTPPSTPTIKDAAPTPLPSQEMSSLTNLSIPSVSPQTVIESTPEPNRIRSQATISNALNSYRDPQYREVSFEDLQSKSQAASGSPQDLFAIIAEVASRFGATRVMLEGLAATLIMNSSSAGDQRSLELYDLVKELYDWETIQQGGAWR
jgi:hypothetical protein